MPSYCAMHGCNSNYKQKGSITFHHFPKNKELSDWWIQLCKREDPLDANYARICSLHFEVTAFERNLKYELLGIPVPKGRTRLKDDAIPTLLLPTLNDKTSNDEMEERKSKVCWKSHPYEMSGMLHKLKEEKQYTDATISCCGSYYPVHKVILAACSPYFEELFHQTEKLHPLVHPVVVLSDVRKVEMEAIINFIYLGEVSVSEKDIPQLLDVARVLNIKGLREICVTKRGQDEKVETSAAYIADSDENTNDNKTQQGRKKRQRSDSESVLNIRIDCVSSVASGSVRKSDRVIRQRGKRRRKTADKDDCSSSEDAISTDEESIAGDSEKTVRTAHNRTRAELRSSVADQSSVTYHHDDQSKDGSEMVQNEDKTGEHLPNEDVFISVGIADPLGSVPGPSGYSSTNEDGDNNHEEAGGVNFEDDEGSVVRIKEEFIEETDSTPTEVIFLPDKDGSGGDDMFKKEALSPGGQESLDSDFDSNSSGHDPREPLLTYKDEMLIPDEDLPNFLKSHKIYRIGPELCGKIKDKFWEQEGVCRLMIGIKDREITLKESATLLGLPYQLMYRQYCSVYGGIKQAWKEASYNEKHGRETPINVDPKKFRKVEFHECPHCPYKNPYKHNFLEHLKYHMGETSSTNSGDSSKGEEPASEKAPSKDGDLVSCEICSAKFAHLRTLRRHMQIHFHVTPLECPFCSVKFDHKTVFKAHLETHKNEKIFDCPLCKVKYADRYSLNEHLKLHYD